MYETFEKLLVVWYKFGLAMNDGLNASFNDLLARAEVQFKTRLFMSIYYKAENGHIRERYRPRPKPMPEARTGVLVSNRLFQGNFRKQLTTITLAVARARTGTRNCYAAYVRTGSTTTVLWRISSGCISTRSR
jgi:hypothetical protein